MKGLNTLDYRGYEAIIDFHSDDKVFFGRVMGPRDALTFDGQSVDELEKNFHEVVDHYLEVCKERGIEPIRQYSGNFNVRIPAGLHAKADLQANINKESLNKFVEKAIEKAVLRE